ncbi:MAG: histidine--tRNA ligase [Actinomycetota bacterium]
MSSRISGPKGAPDLLPPDSRRHEEIISAAIRAFRLWGFHRIDTPVFESTELFERGLAAASDIVTKEMYTFKDKGGRSLTLRPDMTAPVLRATLEHGLDRKGLPVKLYYVSPIFRHERPQAGRYRQFWQAGVEVLGSPGPGVDAEVIGLAAEVYSQLGLTGVTLKLNSIGHPECRALYLPLLLDYLNAHEAELCSDCRRKLHANPLRTFDCKVPEDRKVMENAPVIVDHLCVECKEHYEAVKLLLTTINVEFVEDPTLVRGLDYYTRTAFEFVAEGLGSQDAVGAGGRYDGLSEQIGGPSLPGIGFGLGVERIALAIEQLTPEDATLRPQPLDVFVVSVGAPAQKPAFELVTKLRREGISADLDHSGRAIKGQFKMADRSGARWAVVIGEKELAGSVYTLKDMQTGDETSVPAIQLVRQLRQSSASAVSS